MNTRRNSPWLALLVLASIATVGFIDRIVVNVLVEPVKAEFLLTDLQVSLMAWAFALLNIGAGLVVARIAERVRRLTLISVGTVLWSIRHCALRAGGELETIARRADGRGAGRGDWPARQPIGDCRLLPRQQARAGDILPAAFAAAGSLHRLCRRRLDRAGVRLARDLPDRRDPRPDCRHHRLLLHRRTDARPARSRRERRGATDFRRTRAACSACRAHAIW